METVVSGGAATPVVIGATGVEEVLQNVRTILATAKGSVPLDREFGLEMTFLDAPEPVAMARVASEIVAALRRYEPRARVLGVAWANRDQAMDGALYPLVRIEIDGYVVSA